MDIDAEGFGKEIRVDIKGGIQVRFLSSEILNKNRSAHDPLLLFYTFSVSCCNCWLYLGCLACHDVTLARLG